MQNLSHIQSRYSFGNALGPTQGVGFTNELIARLTNSPVVDGTSSNHTLDSRNATFPLSESPSLYADFSHDNDMTAIFSAMGPSAFRSISRPLSFTLQALRHVSIAFALKTCFLLLVSVHKR